MAIRLGSLFAGIGGFDRGFELAGCQPVWAVEIDPACQRVLRHHFPNLHIESDVREVGAHNLEPVDIITFGSPCQDLSVAGKRKGFNGERSGLYFEAIRIISELGPAIAVWENVPGALSSHSGRDFGRALDELADIGALDIAWAVLDAQWFGVAQRRRRVFVVADFRGHRAGEILALADGLSGHPAPRRTSPEDIAGPISTGASSGGGFRQDLDGTTYVPFDMTQVTSVANRQRLEAGREAPSPHAAGGAHVITHTLSAEGHDASEDGTGRGTPIIPILEATGRQNENDRNDSGLGVGDDGDPMFTLQAGKQHAIAFTNRGLETGTSAETLRAGSHGALPMVAATLTSNGDAHSGHRDEHGLIATAWVGSYGGGGGEASDVSPTLQASGGTDERGVRNPLIATATMDVHPTLSAQTGGPGSQDWQQHSAVATGMAVRRLTPVECCRLQAFPDDWLDLDPPLADSTKYRMLGNAVCVAVSEWLARRIAATPTEP